MRVYILAQIYFSKMPPKSKLWKYFEKNLLEKGVALCRICKKKIKTSGNTSNLKCHLAAVHNNLLVELENADIAASSREAISTILVANEETVTVNEHLEEIVGSPSSSASSSFLKQKTLTEIIKSEISFKEGGEKNEKITECILYMICKDYQPVSIVEDKGFKQLMKTLTNGKYKLPSRKRVNELIEKKYDNISSIIRDKIKNLKHISITTDIWTETLQTRSFLGITVHFVDIHGCKLQCATLGVIDLNERHTAKYIEEVFLNLMAEWEIQQAKVSAIITDGALNIGNAVEKIFGKNKHIHCFAHQINLVAERSIGSCQTLTNLISKQKTIITWFKQSVIASDELRKAQEPNSKKLIQQVVTRWNSTYYSIERFLELRHIINQIVNKHPSAPVMISAREAEELQEVQKLLQPLEAATKQISGENYTTGSMVIPMIYNIVRKINEFTPVYDIGILLKSKLIEQCIKRFSHVEEVSLLSISTILDPRFKKVYFKSPLDCAKAIQTISDEMTANKTNFPMPIQIENNENLEATAGSRLSGEESPNIFNLWDNHVSLVSDNMENVPVISEITQYLKTPLIALQSDPILWWDKNGVTYPNLYTVAQKYHSVIATSVPSERLFSKAGITVTQKRNKIKGKFLSKLLFLQDVPEVYWNI